MTNKEKQLLLKDLSSRLSYEVWICRNRNGEVCDFTLYGIVGERLVSKATYEERSYSKGIERKHFETPLYSKLLNTSCKPYLRSMSSMTEEEKDFYDSMFIEVEGDYFGMFPIAIIDWLNAHYFDYRGLIEKGLALEAPEGMYDTKTQDND